MSLRGAIESKFPVGASDSVFTPSGVKTLHGLGVPRSI